jgi:plastocyanin
MNTLAANKGTFLYFLFILLVATFTCGQTLTVASKAAGPTVSVPITGDYCPSLEVQAGMQIAWTNLGDEERVLIVERQSEQFSKGTSFFDVADTYLISLNEPGQYTYYCSQDRSAFGTITVLQ